MSSKSIREADGKALISYFLSRSPSLSKKPVPALSHRPPPKLAQLEFLGRGSIESVLAAAEMKYPWLLANGARFVAKPDQLIKRRGKSGLLALNKSWEECKAWIQSRAASNVNVEGIDGILTNFLVEPFVPHEANEEYYININSAREGDWILYYHEGGVDVGDVDAKAAKLLVPVDLRQYPSDETIIKTLLKKVPADQHKSLVDFINRLYAIYVDLQFTYLEINPLVVLRADAQVHFLDLAAKIDQTAEFESGSQWAIARSNDALGIAGAEVTGADDGPPMVFPAPFGRTMSPEESYIADLDAKTGASLKLTILNASGRIWTLVAGGGASVVYADAIASCGFASELANYGEYSGAPSETQTYEYAKTVFELMTRGAPHPDGKILFIGGGIANFTNVASTFKGIIRALVTFQSSFHNHKVKVYVRRAGPNWQEGLRAIKACGEEIQIPMQVYGPEMHVSGIVPLALLNKTPKVIGEAPVVSSQVSL